MAEQTLYQIMGRHRAEPLPDPPRIDVPEQGEPLAGGRIGRKQGQRQVGQLVALRPHVMRVGRLHNGLHVRPHVGPHDVDVLHGRRFPMRAS